MYCWNNDKKTEQIFNEKSYEIEEELNDLLENLLSKRNALAKSIDMPKVELWTKDEFAKHLNAGNDGATGD